MNQVPQLAVLNASSTYGERESRIYTATDRFWKTTGVFSYNYQRLSYKEAMVEIEKLNREVTDAYDFKHMAKNQPSCWQETGAIASQMDTLIRSTKAAADISDKILPGDRSNLMDVRNTADILVNDKNYKAIIAEIQAHNGAAGAESSALRKLEGVIIESSAESGAGPEQQNLHNEFNSVKAYLESLMSEYALIHQALTQTAVQIKLHLASQNPSAEQLFSFSREFRQHLETALKLNQLTEQLVGDFGIVLYDLNSAGEVNKEYKYAALNRLYNLWKDTFEERQNTSIDFERGRNLPDGFPSYVVPVMPGTTIAIIKKLPALHQNDGYTLTLKTGLSVNQTANYYEENLWDADFIEQTTRDGITTFTGEKDGYEFSVVIMPNKLGGNEITVIQITLEPLD